MQLISRIRNAFEQINAETLVIGIKEDTLTPIEEQKHIFTALKVCSIDTKCLLLPC